MKNNTAIVFSNIEHYVDLLLYSTVYAKLTTAKTLDDNEAWKKMTGFVFKVCVT